MPYPQGDPSQNPTPPPGPRDANSRDLASGPDANGPSRDSMNFLLAGGADPARDSRRITVALVALVSLSFVLLNIGIYQSARTRLVRERWEQLAASTEEKRKDLRALLEQLEHEAEFIASQDLMRDWIEAGAPAPIEPSQALAMERSLDQAASAFRLQAIEVIAPDGSVVANTTNGALWRTPSGVALAAKVSQTGQTAIATEYGSHNGKSMVIVAAPTRQPGSYGP